MDVTTPEQARIAQEAGACAVMALERIPADIRAAGAYRTGEGAAFQVWSGQAVRGGRVEVRGAEGGSGGAGRWLSVRFCRRHRRTGGWNARRPRKPAKAWTTGQAPMRSRVRTAMSLCLSGRKSAWKERGRPDRKSRLRRPGNAGLRRRVLFLCDGAGGRGEEALPGSAGDG